MTEALKARLYMFACSALWSLSCALVRFIPWNPLVISGWRSAIACVVLLLYLRRCGTRLTLCRKTVYGAVSILLMCSSYITAVKLTSASNAITLQFTSPLFVLLLEFFLFKKRISLVDLFAVLCTMAGVAVLFFEGFSRSQLIGNIFAVAAGFFSACMYVVLGDEDPVLRSSTVFSGHALCALAGIPLTFIYRPEFSLIPLLCILLLGVFQLGLPYVFLLKASGKCPPLSCCIISAVEPMLSPVWVFMLTGEAPGRRAVIGSLIIIASVTLWNVLRLRGTSHDARRTAASVRNRQ